MPVAIDVLLAIYSSWSVTESPCTCGVAKAVRNSEDNQFWIERRIAMNQPLSGGGGWLHEGKTGLQGSAHCVVPTTQLVLSELCPLCTL